MSKRKDPGQSADSVENVEGHARARAGVDPGAEAASADDVEGHHYRGFAGVDPEADDDVEGHLRRM